MQQVIHPFPQSGNVHNQLTAIQHPPGAHLFDSSLQNQPVHPPQNFDIRTQTQQNLLQSHGENQKGLIHPHNAQSQPNFQVGQIQQSLPQIGHPKQDFVVPSKSQYILCHNLQNQQLGASLILPNEPSQPAPTQPSTNPHDLTSAETIASSSLQQPVQGTNSDNPIAHKVVTSEQAAKITDLSASLAQFFGTKALNPQTPTPVTPGLLNPGSIVAAAVPMPNELKPVSGSEEKPHMQLEAMDRSRAGGDAFSKEDKKAETIQSNKEVLAQLQNVEVEAPNDGDSKKAKKLKD
ncbi:hypothetical protein HPP92_013321 [Vanilla planifolia]|uniref:Uncharacterized protein n=1 Tax=Vanilla planifolia TaxID=51239 RepID=A0A835QN73_VANPL|nr:hypothetical protein HPP92_013321 [Vanilla planifolia]